MHFLRLVLTCAMALLPLGCGDDGEANPGWSDPCDTPMAGPLGCPASAVKTPAAAATPEEACNKLLSCSIIAEAFYKEKANDEPGYDPDPGRALQYGWCVRQLRRPPLMPCLDKVPFSPEHVERAIACIMQTPCESLGARLNYKRLSAAERPDFDAYLCPDNIKRWTATTCDNGILPY